jgi:hypothetical protein
LQAVGLSGERLAERTHRRRGGGDPLENRSTIHVRHDDLFSATPLVA